MTTDHHAPTTRGRTGRGTPRPGRRVRRSAAAVGLAAVLAATALPAAGAPAAAPDDAAAQDVAQVTVRPDPSYRGEAFEGWGTSLVWFANATGDYPDEVRERLADLLFGEDGLRLNIARYNVGGGNAPDVPDYLRPGGAVPGWWQAPEGTTREDTDWWDPENPEHWDEEADAAQRWWVDRIKGDVTHWEAFSNSPPWFQTVSGYTSGGFDSSADQIRSDRVDDFAAYMTGVVDRLEAAHGIDVDTIDPLNEPNTPYWGTQLGEDGNPTGGRQEGAHAGPRSQAEVLAALDRALETAGTDAVISAMDETNPGTFATNWYAYPDEVRDAVEQLNVHTYGTGQRPVVRDIAKGWDKPLWQSEVEGSWGSGQDFESMEPGLGMAGRIVDDLRELEPTAWVFWQPVEDYDNMKPGGESAAGANWGSIQLPFDCTAEDTLETCPIYTNTKFDTTRNFTHYIRPGDHLLGVDDTSTVAAETRRGATVVHVNDTAAPREVTLDLSGFRLVQRGATVTPVVTDADGALVGGEPVPVADERASLVVPAESVTTFLVRGVRGADAREATVQDGHVYRLDGVQSDRLLAAEGDGAVIRGDDVSAVEQLWRLEAVTGTGNQTEYALTSAADGRVLRDGTDGLVLVDGDPASDPAARWVGSTTGDGTWTFVNRGTTRLLDVGGQATADGSPVGTWQAGGGANQRWALVDETVLGGAPVEVFTPTGEVPQLPATVPTRLRGGTGVAVPVTWRLPAPRVWDSPGTRTVRGTATDLTGRTHRVEATVVVDTLTTTEPAAAATVPGELPVLPASVTATGSLGVPVQRPVVWDAVDVADLAEVGQVEVTGTVDAGAGRTLPAVAVVDVTPGVPGNVALDAGVSYAASFSEPGYGPAGLRDGRTTDKAWSTWTPDQSRGAETLTATLPAPRTVTGLRLHVLPEGEGTAPVDARVQVRAADGTWVDAGSVTGPATATVVDVPLTTPTRSDAVRVVLTPAAGRYLVASELEVLALVPGTPAG
ncbi:RICIN domain-containing protein [Pseudokineococcus lusitanus]|uniref:Ig-like protein group 4 n=1 Tax=Pseudokineococcus lusitanus TaxID=763993 RepID=A0A3N1HQK1_9ACTN|nr:RICIN domain-containing protein [Pseudokineococcus lusitanus]ROP44793.1 Ig-like protein group 4 [Pseudokineococcus lusitanus]